MNAFIYDQHLFESSSESESESYDACYSNNQSDNEHDHDDDDDDDDECQGRKSKIEDKYYIIYNYSSKHTYYCKKCDYYCHKHSTMCMHQSIKHNETALYECKHCKETFPVKSQLQQHMKNHHNEKGFPCISGGCEQKFKQKSSMMIHYMRHHMPKKTLLYHIDKDPFFKKQVVCNSCNQRFTKNSIIYHVTKCSPLSPFSL